MTKSEAYQAMLEGYKVRNEYYTPEEFAFINKDGLIELEDGVIAGTQHDEFWAKYQAWDKGWETCGIVPEDQRPTPVMIMQEPKPPMIWGPHDSAPLIMHKLPEIPPRFIDLSSNLIPKKERKDYRPLAQPKTVKRKRKPKTFGKNKRK